jgi:hypothetical protein
VRSAFIIIASGMLLAACYKCSDPACRNVTPIQPDYPAGDYQVDGGDVDVPPDDSEAALSSPCGRACATMRELRCGEGDPSATGVTCYRVCLRAASLRTVPAGCWASAKTVDQLRACGGVRCAR